MCMGGLQASKHGIITEGSGPRTKEQCTARPKAAQQERQRDIADQRLIEASHGHQSQERSDACLRDLDQSRGWRGVANAPTHFEHIGPDGKPGSRAVGQQSAPLGLGIGIWTVHSSRWLQCLHIQVITGCCDVRCYLGNKRDMLELHDGLKQDTLRRRGTTQVCASPLLCRLAMYDRAPPSPNPKRSSSCRARVDFSTPADSTEALPCGGVPGNRGSDQEQRSSLHQVMHHRYGTSRANVSLEATSEVAL